MLQQDHHLVIIGMGVAGITLAKHVRNHSSCRITVISDEHPVHFSRPALMYVYMGHMRQQDIEPYEPWWYQENKIEPLLAHVEHVDFNQKSLQLSNQESLKFDVLVIATGSTPVFYNWPGQQLKGVQSLVRLPDLHLLEQNSAGVKEAVVVGGGLIGIEAAEMLKSRNIQVTMLVRDKLYARSILPEEESELVTSEIKKHAIKVRYQEELKEILPDKQGRVEAVQTLSGTQISCQLVIIATGVAPNIRFLQTTELETEKGVLVNSYFETNLQRVYAIGDCAQFREIAPGELAIEQLWYTARQHAETLAQTLTGSRTAYV
ncbi:MAG: FAD-dependent oxidoreductase, partial [Hymenobacteraceae bacterium]|nr:FAD-dependent oxidoreductase [Hymenobacteraceae bacterium]MDX5395788.1 FAD-dependent oxidoreductase [Hymenobacteraceae bacterium]MDX5511843.1 FAD-dependent oxidoreductase [Hymenobacteraceae bacterium]